MLGRRRARLHLVAIKPIASGSAAAERKSLFLRIGALFIGADGPTGISSGEFS